MLKLLKLSALLLLLGAIGFYPHLSQAQNPFEKGLNWYQQRAAEADSFRAEPANINKAIEAFEEAIEQGVQPEKSAEYLLRSYYFKGMYVGLSKDQQKEVYDRGKEFGERMMEEHPKSAAIKFWYAANSGRWADVHGFWAAARDGLAKKLREICNEIIEIAPEYQGGGGYRVLAQVHFHSPNIPLVMSWPSDKKARELLEKAIEIAPRNPTNLLAYAEVLLNFNEQQKARTQLETILDLELREGYKVEDRFVKYKARQLLKEHFEGV